MFTVNLCKLMNTVEDKMDEESPSLLARAMSVCGRPGEQSFSQIPLLAALLPRDFLSPKGNQGISPGGTVDASAYWLKISKTYSIV